MATLADLHNLIKDNKNIALFIHERPDGDALASALALKELITTNFKHLKKRVDIFVPIPNGLPELYQPVVGNTLLNKKRLGKYGLSIALDCPTSSRFAPYEYIFKTSKNTVNIDHHESNTKFADYNFVLPKASSTCEMLYLFANSLNLKINSTFAKYIYTGIITDTVCLTQGQITKITYKTLAEISKKDFGQEAIKNHFFKTNTKAKTFLLERALRSIKFYENDKIALMQLSNKTFEKLNATIEDTLGIVDHANNIEGVQVAVIIIENQPNNYYVSLRSKGEIKVSQIANHFNGGGHSTMAAFQYNGELSDLKNTLVKTCKASIRENENNNVLTK